MPGENLFSFTSMMVGQSVFDLQFSIFVGTEDLRHLGSFLLNELWVVFFFLEEKLKTHFLVSKMAELMWSKKTGNVFHLLLEVFPSMFVS